MRIYRSDDRGDPFILVLRDRGTDGRPLAKVLRLNFRQHEVRRRICDETAAELNRVVELLGEAAASLVATGVWREFNSAGTIAKPLSTSLRAHLEARDPSVRHVVRARHALASAARALAALAKEPSDE